ncbi:major antigen-like [Aricia agestis]|uniref:major antigen-like n=1 Tax=Aricia agestis TaxID=91739 RepID=UPI001C206997|nr:major antigen-like [Aricia agestis]
MAMSLQRTPPQHYLSDSDLGRDPDSDYIPTRKRKHQLDYDDVLSALENKLEQHLSTMNEKITMNINKCVSTAVSVTLTQELLKLTETIEKLNVTTQNLSLDNVKINKSLAEVNERLLETEKSLQFAHETDKDLETRLKSIEEKTFHHNESQRCLIELENKISAMEQQARQCNIEVSNLLERRSEDLLHLFECICKEIN